MDYRSVFFLGLTVFTAAMILLPYAFGAIWYPTSAKAIRAMIAFGQIGKDDTVVDLGSGDGRVLIAVARRTGASCIGVEINPVMVIISKIRVCLSGQRRRVSIRWANAYRFDLDRADIVLVYLSHKAMDRLRPLVREKMRPDARLVSHGFLMRDWPPRRRDIAQSVYLYRTSDCA